MIPAISIIICTYNRYHYLEKSLASLENQTFGKDNFEILIIDAGSTDNPPDRIKKFAENLPILFFSAPQAGLSETRNIGIKNASGDILAFLDDDALADPEWLEQIHQSFQSTRYRICACGGKSLLLPEIPLPPWLDTGMLQFMGQLDYGDTGFFMDASQQNPVGLNMAFRKRTFDHLGLFNPCLGRSGGTLLSNEEIDIFRKMRRNNLPIFYNPKMLVYHHVAKERITKNFFYTRYFWQGRSDAVMDADEKFSIKGFLKILFRICIRPLRLVKISLFTQFKSKEQKQAVFRCALEYHRGYLRQIVSLN
jgi:glucosyl-dolichyl phosphate glucuronosyltransferase